MLCIKGTIQVLTPLLRAPGLAPERGESSSVPSSCDPWISPCPKQTHPLNYMQSSTAALKCFVNEFSNQEMDRTIKLDIIFFFTISSISQELDNISIS